MKKKVGKKFYILYVNQWFYDISEAGISLIYNQPIEPILVDKYITIAETKDNIKFKDLIYKGIKYKSDLNVSFGQLREIVYFEQINNFKQNMTRKEYLGYLKEYIEKHKEEINNLLNNEEFNESKNLIIQKKGGY